MSVTVSLVPDSCLFGDHSAGTTGLWPWVGPVVEVKRRSVDPVPVSSYERESPLFARVSPQSYPVVVVLHRLPIIYSYIVISQVSQCTL